MISAVSGELVCECGGRDTGWCITYLSWAKKEAKHTIEKECTSEQARTVPAGYRDINSR